MKRSHWLAILIPIIALLIGLWLTDFAALSYKDWEWRYALRIVLAGVALLLSGWVTRRLPLRQKAVLLVALIPLLLCIPHARDLYGGTGRAFGAYPPTIPGGDPIDFEYEWLPHTDRLLN